MTHSTHEEYSGLEVAVIGMAGRFPGAPDLAAYWRNLVEGHESIRHWSRGELIELGLSSEQIDRTDFVPAGAPLEEADRFDASFFGYSPGEAEILDPQQRLFLECAWHALETAGYTANGYPGAIGVYAAAGMNTYLFNLSDNARIRDSVSKYELFVANDKDFLATRTAFKLNLRGPGVTVQTACSSSLVAIHMAVQSLIAGECDMALAGGVGLSWQYGYHAREGGILSADGHCRAFDARAAGTVPGSGVGVVTLKRLEDALADGDTIDAVIRGSAINNDGGLKASFTAPQVDSQAAVIAAAQDAAGISADTVGYVEAHGTGTPLGDPIELAALTQAFRRHTDRRGYCALGSVKTNIGHLDTAAGVAGFIKAVLMLRHRKLPPSLHFETGNPQIDFAASPFTVNATLRDWEASLPRRAGVSSFGIGGTNAHVILEEAPAGDPGLVDASPQLLQLSARNADALGELASSLASHLEAAAHAPLADVAHTLREGRQAFAHRQAVVAASAESAAAQLRTLTDLSAVASETASPTVFLFPGQGSQYASMGHELHAGFPAFREHFDACAKRLDDLLQRDFRQVLFAGGDDVHQTELAQPALFAMEYALAQTWSSFDVTPRAMHGHSIGEYVAACIAGVFDLDTALRLVVERARLMQQAPKGAMLAIMHADGSVEEWLDDDIALAAVNAPGMSVVAGPTDAIGSLRARLKKAGLAGRQLQTSHAFHSPMMRDAATTFREIVAQAQLNAPAIPMISNVTGDWLTEEQATDPTYWADHLLSTVRFAQGTQRLLSLGDAVFLEIGPGNTLSTLTALQAPANACTIPGLGIGNDDETTRLLGAVGKYWQAGGRLSWPRDGERRRVPLPTYPFQRQRFWVDPDVMQPAGEPRKAAAAGKGPTLYRPSWRRLPPTAGHAGRGRWLICDDGVIGGALAGLIERGGGDAYRATPASAFEESGYRSFTVAADNRQDLQSVIHALEERDARPDHVVYLWPLADHTKGNAFDPAAALQMLVDAVAGTDNPLKLTVVTRTTADVTGGETLDTTQAATAGLLEAIDQEYPWVSCRLVDLEPGGNDAPARDAEWLHAELGGSERIVARRGTHRWTLEYAAETLPERAVKPPRLRQGGVFVIVGNIAEGLGRIWSEGLAAIRGVRLAWLHDIGAPDCRVPAGVEVDEQRIDCADPTALSAALSKIVERWGRIDGVFLSISLISPEAIAPLALLDQSHWTFNRRSKVKPVRALAETLEGRKIGFCCIQSSLSTIVGGFGLGAYAAGYREAEVLAASQSRDASCPWLVVNYALNHAADNGERHAANPFAVDADVAWDVTRKLIETGWSGQFAIAHGKLDRLRNRVETPQSAPVKAGRHARPNIPVPHTAPRNEVETTVVGIFEELLDIDGIGVDDGFFELGGHSLLAIRVVARLRQAFPVDVEMRELLLENPTAAGIAEAIVARLPQSSELDAMAVLLAEVEGLSDQQVKTQISGAGAQ